MASATSSRGTNHCQLEPWTASDFLNHQRMNREYGVVKVLLVCCCYMVTVAMLYSNTMNALSALSSKPARI